MNHVIILKNFLKQINNFCIFFRVQKSFFPVGFDSVLFHACIYFIALYINFPQLHTTNVLELQPLVHDYRRRTYETTKRCQQEFFFKLDDSVFISRWWWYCVGEQLPTKLWQNRVLEQTENFTTENCKINESCLSKEICLRNDYIYVIH